MSARGPVILRCMTSLAPARSVRRIGMVLGCLGLLGAAMPAAAPAAPAGPRIIQPLRADARPGGLSFFKFRDKVLDRPRASMSALTRGLITRRYRTRDGRSVEITLSSSFPDVPENRAGAQSFASFLGSRVHGAELSSLRVFVGTEAEVNAICGGVAGVLACYSAAQRRMFVPDRDPQAGGPFTREYAVTHEYGHHIARARSNYPFRALNYGAKYWSSYNYVCARTRAGQLAPGNQGPRYVDDPGEGFADTYAHVHYPSVIWQYAEILRPNAGSFAAVRRDVLRPWRVPQRRMLRGAGTRTFQVTQSLDGVVAFYLAGPSRANYDLQLIYQGRPVRQTSSPGSRDRMVTLSCRAPGVPRATYGIRVVRRSGGGTYQLRASVVG